MTNDKMGFITAPRGVRASLFRRPDHRGVEERSIDRSICARLMHVAIGVEEAGASSVRLLIDLCILASFDERVWVATVFGPKAKLPMSPVEDRAVATGAAPTGVLTHVPVDRRYGHFLSVGHERADEIAFRSPTAFVSHVDPAACQALTFRLFFDAHDERQATGMAEHLCATFLASESATSNLASALAAVRSSLLERQDNPWHLMPLTYRAAAVCKGWNERVGSPEPFVEPRPSGGWPEPLAVRELYDLLAKRCEVMWLAATKVFEAHELADGARTIDEDFVTEDDVADDFVSADRMMMLWFGSKRRNRRRT